MSCYNYTFTNDTGQCSVNFRSCRINTTQNDSCVYNFVADSFKNNISSLSSLGCFNTTEIFTYPVYVSAEGVRKIWEEWDLPVLVLYILFTQLYLLVFGRRRRKGTNRRSVINLNVWLLYLLADLVATIALGKLSNIKKESENYYHVNPRSVVRGMWAPIILFYLGGPDTITVLALEENQMWSRHLVALLTQGLRTSYVLYGTWAKGSTLSVLSLGMLIPGIIKYGERVWVVRSTVGGMAEGFVQSGDNTFINWDQDKNNNSSTSSYCSPNEPIIEAYYCFQTLKPHIPGYGCDRTRLGNFVEKFQKWATSFGDGNNNVDVFKLIEIELGFMYDVLFSKIGVIFTVWGCILRFISFSCIVCVLVGFFFIVGNDYDNLKPDSPITIVLLLGAVLLEIGGVLVQLGSDWAVVWASKLATAPSLVSTMVSTTILCLHKLVICKSRKRWAGLMGQFSLLHYCNKYEPTMCNEMMSSICGSARTLKMKFSLPSSHVTDDVKKLIIDQLCKRSQDVVSNELETLQTFSTMTRGEWALKECRALALKKSVEFEFAESLIIWHIATEVCYHTDSDLDSDSEEAKQKVMVPTRMLSNYMMHLLVIRASTFPICNINVDLLKVRNDMKEILKGKGSTITSSDAKACQLLLDEENSSSNATLSSAQELAGKLKADANRWTIMSKVWVEMLCYAASRCSLKRHSQELRHGGEFITHVWLLLQHFGVTRNLHENRPAGEVTDLAKNALKSVPSAVGVFENMLSSGFGSGFCC